MIKHVILWNLKDEFSCEEKEEIKKNIKKGLESLSGKIPGLIDIKVNINGLDSSTADLMLDSTFETIDCLKNYSVNPVHVEIANTYVRPFVKTRACLDYDDMKLFKGLYE